MKRLLLGLTALLFSASAVLAQSGIPISALPQATVPLSGSELLVVMQNNATKKATASQVASSFGVGGLCTNCTLGGTTTNTGTITGGALTPGTALGLAYGGTGVALTADLGAIPYSTGSTLALLAHTATARQVLQSGASAAPSWSTATYPATTTINQLLYSGSANTIAGLATGNNGVLVTSAGGVPSISSTLPSGIIIPSPTISGNLAMTGTTFTFQSGGVTGSLVWSPSSTNKTITLPNGTTDFTATGGTGQVLRQSSAGAAITVATLACSDLSNGATGCSTATGTSGATIPLLNGTNTWSGAQTFSSGDLKIGGAGAGVQTLTYANSASSTTITFPAGTTDFSATGGTSQVVKQTSSGGAFTVAQLACGDLSNSTTACSTSIGTSGAAIPLLNGVNTWSAVQTFNSGDLSATSAALASPAISGGQSTTAGVMGFGAGLLSYGDGATNHALVGADVTQTLSNKTFSDSITLGQSSALTINAGGIGFAKTAASASAPGAAGGKLEWRCGTNAGSIKIVAYGGTSSTGVTVTDNIGSGVTGC